MRTIAHISDIHFGKIDLHVADALAIELAERKPNLLVASGDFTQRARRGQYTDAANYLKRLPQPRILVPGNHDIPLYDVFHRFFGSLDNYRRYISDDLHPIYRDEEMLVIGLNTARPFTFSLNGFWKDGDISEQQLWDIELLARDWPKELMKVVVTHHPFIPPPGDRGHGIVHNATRALDVLEKSGVDLLLAGHLHTGYSGDVRTHHEAVKRSILSIQAGTTTSTRRRGQANAYNWISIEHDRVSIEVRQWNGAKFETFTLENFARVNEAWKKLER
jgi:3',5'-cyclic AMP phosphodiesterase CpdA